MNGRCFVCSLGGFSSRLESNSHTVEFCTCANCGSYFCDKVVELQRLQNLDPRQRALLSHAIRKRQVPNGEFPKLFPDWIDDVLCGELPKPLEQSHNFVLWLGNNVQGIAKYRDIRHEHVRAILGALDSDEVIFVLKWILKLQYVEEPENDSRLARAGRTYDDSFQLRFTPEGWQKYYDVQRTSKESRVAFMAMKYGDEELLSVYNDYFKPAVKNTGFELKKLDEDPQAGIIDVRMEVELRKARFLVADLSHNNLGVYWEAGFGTALEKPVIYTRKKGSDGPHFDVNHRHYVEWDPNDLDDAANRLKATIRATLPREANLEDPADTLAH